MFHRHTENISRLIATFSFTIIMSCLFFGLTGIWEGKTAILMGAAGIAWLCFCFFRPAWGLYVFLGLLTSFYFRGRFPNPLADGQGHFFAVLDLLWGGMLVGFIHPFYRLFTAPNFLPPIVSKWKFIIPFIFLSTFLPLVGVVCQGWPLGYALPGLRTLQWCSLSFCFMAISYEQGVRPVATGIVRTFAIAMGAHTLHALVQYGVFLNFLDDSWLLIDEAYNSLTQQTPATENFHFIYPRMTGLEVSPNAYGLLAALAGVMTVAWGFSEGHKKPFSFITLGTSALIGLGLSASRGGLLGFVVGALCVAGVALLQIRDKRKILKIMLGLCASPFLLIPLLFVILPAKLAYRLFNLSAVLQGDTDADSNAAERIVEWARILDLYWKDYPFGTWVAPSYALKSPVDSYYVFTFIQGTPLFALLFLLFLGGLFMLGWQTLRLKDSPLPAFIPLSLIGFSGVLAAASVSMSPILLPALTGMLWSLIGVCTIAFRPHPKVFS